MKKILIDSDVCLDSITGRYPWSIHADKTLQLCEEKKLTGVISAESVSNIYYILRKLSTHQKALDQIKNLRLILKIGSISQSVIDKALYSGWKDFEDAIQYFCAVNEKCDAIITRNTSDFNQGKLSVYEPDEFLKIFNKENS